jgi:hypothetical protein
MIGNAIVWKLKNDTAVSAAVGDNIFPHNAPMDINVMPQILYEFKTPTAEINYSGATGLYSMEVSIYCVGKLYSDAQALARLVLVALQGQGGLWDTINVDNCIFQDYAEDNNMNPNDPNDILFYVCEPTFIVWFKL